MIEEKIPIQIFGLTFEIMGSPSDQLHYNALAQYVENKMKEAEASTHTVSTQKLAVLAALNIADELFHERNQKHDSGKSVDKKHEELIHYLNGLLEEPANN